MIFPEQMGLERLATDVASRRGHVHRFTGGPDREHTPERNLLCRLAKRGFPSVRFHDVHDDGGNQHDKECDRAELRRRIVNVLWTDMPNDETKGEEANE